MGEGGALRPTRRATRVEQPRRIPGLSRHDRTRVATVVGAQRVPLLTRSDDHLLQPGHDSDQGRDRLGVLGIGDDDRRPTVLEDVGDLFAMQPGVDGHGDQPGIPDRELRLEVFRAVAHDDGDAVSGFEPPASAQPRGESADPPGELGPRRGDRVADRVGGAVGNAQSVAFDPGRDVHDAKIAAAAGRGQAIGAALSGP